MRCAKCSRIRAKAAGSAPWKLKIDCFSSPTAKMVRRASPRAFAGEEFLREGGDHLPLLGAGVLRLVDQDVIEAAIELVQHPGRHALAAQQVARTPMIRSS